MTAPPGRPLQLVDAPPPSAGPESHRRPDIQGLRGVALILVVAYHAGLPLPGGFASLDMFFVISGLVITGMLSREWTATGRVRFGRFYLRRFTRLTPALALVVAVTMVAAALLLSPMGPQQTAAQTGVGAVLLFANVVIARTSGGYFNDDAASNPLLNMWSLSVEEQFYLIFPAVIVLGWFLVRRYRLPGSTPLAMVTTLAGLSFLLTALGAAGFTLDHGSWLMGYFSLLTRAWEFAAGAILGLASHRLGVLTRGGAQFCGWLGAGAIVASLLLITSDTPYPGWWTLLPVGGTLLLLHAGTRPDNPVSRLLAASALVKIGDWSYSMYLWHWPVIVFAVILWPDVPLIAAMAAVLSLVPALVAYRWVEQPLRRVSLPSRSRILAMVALTIIPPLLLAASLLFGARVGWGIAAVQDAQARLSVGHIGYLDCMTQQGDGGPGPQDPAACTLNEEAAGAPVFLVGDSTAAAYSEAALGAAVQLGRPLRVSTAAGCPFIDIYRGSTRGIRPGDLACRQYYESTMSKLRAQATGVVVIAASTGYWDDDLLTIGQQPDSGSNDPVTKARNLETGLQATVTELRQSGHTVVLTKPYFHFDDPSTPVTLNSCSLASIVLAGCPESVAASQIDPVQHEAQLSVQRVAAQTGAPMIDISAFQCPGGVCGDHVGSVPLYMDSAHISADLSRVLVPAFASAIAAAG